MSEQPKMEWPEKTPEEYWDKKIQKRCQRVRNLAIDECKTAHAAHQKKMREYWSADKIEKIIYDQLMINPYWIDIQHNERLCYGIAQYLATAIHNEMFGDK